MTVEPSVRRAETPAAQPGQERENESALEASLRDLQRKEHRLRLALDAGRMGAWEWEVDAGRVIWSPTLEDIHGVPRGSFAGTFDAFWHDIHPNDREHVQRELQSLATSDRSEHFLQYRIVRPDGQVRWLEAHGQVDRDPSGAPVRVVGVCMDITERKRLEEQRAASTVRKALLVKITGAIAASITADDVFAAVVDEVASTLGAASAGLWLVDEDGTARLVRSIGYREDTKAALTRLAIHTEPGTMPILDTLRTGEPRWIASRQELVRDYPLVSSMVTAGREYRVSCLPIHDASGNVIAALGLTFDDAPPQDENERNFLKLVASYCAQALERLRLLEAERRSRDRAEASAARMALLSRASRAFSEAGPDLGALLRIIVQEVCTDLAEACAIVLLPEMGTDLVVAAAEHRDQEMLALARALVERSPIELGRGITGRVASTGQPMLVPRVDPSFYDGPEYAAYRPLLEKWRPSSVLAVPLRLHGRVLGTLAALRSHELPAFDEDDLHLVQELSERAALAIESSRLHEENRQARLRAELLYRLAAGVIGAEGQAQLFHTALDGLESALGAERSSILVYDPDGVMRFKAWSGLSQEYRDAVEGHSPWPRDAKDPQPIIIPDVEADPAVAAYLPVFRKEKIRGVGFIPLLVEGRILGKFMVYYGEPRQAASHELDMARAIANHVAAAVAHFAAIEALQQTVRYNEMFTGMLGHDLRNPLGAIMTSAQLAMMRQESPRMLKPLQRIVSAGSRMSRMIDQLLDFTRVRVGSGIPIEPRPTDLLPLLREVIDELDGGSSPKAFAFEHVGDAAGAWDPDRLSQVFSNVIANAVQHGASGRCCTVRVDGTASELVRVDVHNHGSIPADLLPHLFDPLSGNERRRSKSQGLGLGLFISSQIVDAHGGRIEVRSSEDHGTTLRVVLPRAMARIEQRG